MKTGQHCKGLGIAKRCESEGGEKEDFVSYILQFWDTINYNPETPIEQFEEPLHQEECSIFTPKKVLSMSDKFTGICIKNIPKDTNNGLIVEFS